MTKSINQASFGQNAESYARSTVHAQGASLQRPGKAPAVMRKAG